MPTMPSFSLGKVRGMVVEITRISVLDLMAVRHTVGIFVTLSSSDTDGLGYSLQGLKLSLTHLILNEFYLGIMSLLIRF
jgi:hypothetical protein